MHILRLSNGPLSLWNYHIVSIQTLLVMHTSVGQVKSKLIHSDAAECSMLTVISTPMGAFGGTRGGGEGSSWQGVKCHSPPPWPDEAV